MPADTPPSALVMGRMACTEYLRQMLVALAFPTGADALGTKAPLAAHADVWLIDHHFAGWPLDDAQVLQALAQWLRLAGHHRLHLIGVDFDAVARAYPRFSRWRRDWSHRLDIHQPVDIPLPAGLRLLLAGQQAALWLDAPDARLRKVTHPAQLATLRADIADFLQRCEPAWPVTALGL